MTIESNKIADRRCLPRLVRCLRVLGWRNGWRYWRTQNWAIRNPERVLQWADDCETKADKIEATDPKGAWCFRDWAKRLRESYSANAELCGPSRERQPETPDQP